MGGMLRLIQLLIHCHIHKWTILDDYALNTHSGGVGHRYHLQCQKCGDVMKRDLI